MSRAAILRKKFSPADSILTPGQAVLALTLLRRASSRTATTALMFRPGMTIQGTAGVNPGMTVQGTAGVNPGITVQGTAGVNPGMTVQGQRGSIQV